MDSKNEAKTARALRRVSNGEGNACFFSVLDKAPHHTAICESVRGSVPPQSTPLAGSRRTIWPRP